MRTFMEAALLEKQKLEALVDRLTTDLNVRRAHAHVHPHMHMHMHPYARKLHIHTDPHASNTTRHAHARNSALVRDQS